MTENKSSSKGVSMVVAVEVEVIYLHPLRVEPERHLIAGCLKKSGSGRNETLQGLPVPDEKPEDCARRLVATAVGPENVLHTPELVGVFHYRDRQDERPTLTVSYVVLGRATRATAPYTEDYDLDDGNLYTEHLLSHSETIRAARKVAVRLLETTPIALKLLDEPDEPFTLQQLWEVYACVRGKRARADPANFRRKVEAANNFVVRFTGQAPSAESKRSLGRQPNLYVAGSATRLVPPVRFERTSSSKTGQPRR